MNIDNIYKKFPTHQSCIKQLERAFWGKKSMCPYCKCTKSTQVKGVSRYHCNICNSSYSVTAGTMFHKTRVDIQKWFSAISIMLDSVDTISARQLAKDIEVDKNTAWYMILRIKRALIDKRELLERILEK